MVLSFNVWAERARSGRTRSPKSCRFSCCCSACGQQRLCCCTCACRNSEVSMKEREVLELLQTQAKLLAGMSAAQLALERVVLALIETHPDKPALLARIQAQL